MIHTVQIRLDRDDKQTLSDLIVYDNAHKLFRCQILEPRDCIAAGEYFYHARFSDKHKRHLIIRTADGGHPAGWEWVLCHIGNYYDDTEGCQLPGKGFTDINNDGYRDVTSSAITLSNLIHVLKLHIYDGEVESKESVRLKIVEAMP
jgi:hypothetical protein